MSKQEKIFAIVEKDEGYRRFVEGEEIIRCRDCKHYADYRCSYFLQDEYDHDIDDTVTMFALVKPDGFCAWAQRKED